MNSLELTKLMQRNEHTKKYFMGCFPSDKIPLIKVKYPHCMIVNTDDSESSGTHWIGIFIPRKNVIEYYDSFGEWPPSSINISEYLKSFSTVSYNTISLQSPLSGSCGKHVLYFLFKRCNNIAFQRIIRNLQEHICANDQNNPDRIVSAFVRYHFFKLKNI